MATTAYFELIQSRIPPLNAETSGQQGTWCDMLLSFSNKDRGHGCGVESSFTHEFNKPLDSKTQKTKSRRTKKKAIWPYPCHSFNKESKWRLAQEGPVWGRYNKYITTNFN
ncbi:MAG: hypothetical protein ACRD3W_24995 [Terriglobales bacterium]